MRSYQWISFIWILSAQCILQRITPIFCVSGEDLGGETPASTSLNSTSSEPDSIDAGQLKAENVSSSSAKEDSSGTPSSETKIVQTGPFLDLLGPTLLSLQMIDESHAQINSHATSDVLNGKHVVGIYFSAGM